MLKKIVNFFFNITNSLIFLSLNGHKQYNQ